jgi:hypothetical protein
MGIYPTPGYWFRTPEASLQTGQLPQITGRVVIEMETYRP